GSAVCSSELVRADALDDPGQHALGGRLVGPAEPQGVHHRDRAGAHGEDVADDAADPGGRALVRLHVRGVVVRLDLEGDGPAVADVNHPGVLPHADEQRVALRGLRGELPEVHLGRLVGAVLAPHHRVDRQLRAGRPPAEDLADPLVLVVLHAELGVRLRLVRGLRRTLDRVEGHAFTSLFRIEVKKPRPSTLGAPVSSSTACSGWGMRPTMLPASLVMPAMSLSEPFGLPPAYRKTTRPSRSSSASVSSSATYRPSPCLIGSSSSWPGSKSQVHAVRVFSTRMR